MYQHIQSLQHPSVSSAAQRLARLLDPLPGFCAHLPGSSKRAAVESYVAGQFELAHGAVITDFMPLLVSMECHGQLTAAAGMRPAIRQPLFLEQYLDQPVEAVISGLSNTGVRRAQIAEIGNLVATRKGSSYLLFLVLTGVLETAGFDWVVFTATPQVRRTLDGLGFSTHRLCAADPVRLRQPHLADWGSYYAREPAVLAGSVTDAMQMVNRHPLYRGAHSLFRREIDTLANAAGSVRNGRGTASFSA